jgi:16S rRNA processing protein RimM
MTDQICLGAIAGAFGVKGEVRLKSFTTEPEDVAAYGALTTEDGSREFAVTLTGQTAKGALVVRLSDVLTKEQADDLRGVRLYVPRERLPSLPDDEFYHADLGLGICSKCMAPASNPPSFCLSPMMLCQPST